MLIDDQPWEGETANGRLLVEVSAGQHRVEVRKDGYVTFVTDVRIRRGDTTNLNVNLSRDDRLAGGGSRIITSFEI